jgi:hypothetical protein
MPNPRCQKAWNNSPAMTSQFLRNCFSRLAKRAGLCFDAGMPEAAELKEAAGTRGCARFSMRLRLRPPNTPVPAPGSRGGIRRYAAHAALGLALLGCLSSLAAEPGFHQQYLSFSTNNPESWEVRSPRLVDTNNTGYKLRSVLTNLANLKTTAALAGVRPGMTMDEVVTQWGRPPEMWAKGFEGPRFCYKEVSVFFDASGNAVKSIFTQDFPGLERALMVTPKIEECLRALGQPNFRDDTASGSQCWLIYEMTNIVIKVGCVRGRLSTIQMDRRE